MQQIWQVIPEFIKSGQLQPEILFEIITAKSLSEMKYKVQKALRKQEEKNDVVKKLQEQLEQAGQQNQQLQQQLKEVSSQLKKLDEQKMRLEQEKMQLQYKVDWFKAQADQKYKQDQIDLARKRTEVQILQLRDGNPYDDPVRGTGLTSPMSE